MTDYLPCPIDANPPVYTVTWTKNNQLVDLSSNGRIGLGQDWSLVFTDIRSEDTGAYTCTPYNDNGMGRSSDLMQVVVRDPPYFTMRPNPYYQRMPGESVTFPCAASGTPLPVISWRKPDSYVPDDSRVSRDRHNLTISQLQKSDHGKYECVAKNVVTTVITSTLLIIEMTTPHAPYNVTVTTTQFSAKIDWKPAYDGGYPQRYVIWFKRENDQGWQTISVLPLEATSFTIHKLVPDSAYEFMVMSRNQLGNGLSSNKVLARTKGYDGSLPITPPTNSMGQTYFPRIESPQGPRPGTPENITAILFDNGTIRVSWDPPTASQVPIFYYHLRYRKLGSARWETTSGKIKHPQTYYTLRGLLEGDTYQFQVIAYSLYAYSYPSNVAEIVIDKVVPVSILNAGGIISIAVGCVLILIITIIIIVVVCRVRRQKKKRRKEEKYGDIKYDTPNHVNAFNKNQEKNARKDPDGFSGFSGVKPEIYVVHGPQETTDPYKDNLLAAEKWNRPRDKNIFDRNFIGYEPDKVRKVHRDHGGSYPVDIDFYHHPSEIHRTADGRFLPWSDGDNYVNMDHHDVNDIISEPHVYFTPGAGPLGNYNDHPSARLRTTESGEHLSRRDSYEDAIRRYSPRPEEYDTGQYSPRRRENEYRGQFGPRFQPQQHGRMSPGPVFEFDPRRMSQQFRDYIANPPSSQYIPGGPPGSYLPTPPGDLYPRRGSPTPGDVGYQRRFIPRSQEAHIPRRYQPRHQRDSYDDQQPHFQPWDGYERRLSQPSRGSYDDEQYLPYRSRSSPPIGRYPEEYDYYQPPQNEERPRSHSMPPHTYSNRGYEYDDFSQPPYAEEPYFSPQSRMRPEPQVPVRDHSRDPSPYDRYGPPRPAFEHPGQEPPPPRVPPFQRGSHATEDSMQSFQTPSIGSEREEAVHPRSMVRHSTAKPLRPDRTFHTSSPSEELGLQPFDLDEISSVNPSSTATSRRTFPSSSTFPTSSSNFPSSTSNIQDGGHSQARQSAAALSPVIDMSSIPPESSDMYQLDPQEPQRRFSAGDIPQTDTRRLSRDSSPSRERQIARVSPSPKREETPSYPRGEGSEERPFHYTRDRLQGAIERARRGPIARRLQGSSRGSAPDVDQPSETPRHSWNALTPSTGEKTRDDSGRDGETTVIPQTFADSVAPYKDIPANRTSVTSGLSGSSGRGSSGGAVSKSASLSHSQPNISQMDQSGDMPSSSSGQGSRNTSQTMSSSSQSARGRMNSSLSSTNTPQEHDISTESSPYSIGDTQHKRDASVDENYEFDNPTESELLDALRNVSKTSRNSSRDFNSSDPDISRHERTGRGDRFSKLREEYKQYRRKQQLQQPESPGGEQWEEIESELL
ncbi:protein turtle-like isoform X2 [Lingula anatina]|uniref:Protein turtle-like isoform X1 n=1 Tax=Lingula anatina TaxID=7574 RepID=A0A1S3ID54_LINAN|nr:protein turtle-like isoform X1 [Lingula anatina]XP_013395369.1 protein turtle-like isoform X2 [Lingula anatina]|eukprot:XP_013395368.1 protein turtle-like isoform X1 [Lingula anatina]